MFASCGFLMPSKIVVKLIEIKGKLLKNRFERIFWCNFHWIFVVRLRREPWNLSKSRGEISASVFGKFSLDLHPPHWTGAEKITNHHRKMKDLGAYRKILEN